MFTINELIPNWKQILSNNTKKISFEYNDLIAILKQLIKDRNIEEISKFFKNITMNPIDINDDKNPAIYEFLAQFANLKPAPCQNYDKKEQMTLNHYLCFKSVYHRGESDELSVITFLPKKYLLCEATYNCFLMANNLVGMETFLYTYEFSKPIFNKKYEVQCNNIVLTMKPDKNLVRANKKSDDWLKLLNSKFEKLNILPRTAFINGEELIVVIDLLKTINMTCNGITYILHQVEKALNNEFSEFNTYENDGFFMVPGSINAGMTRKFDKSKFMYRAKSFDNSGINFLEFGYTRCYFAGEEVYSGNPPSLTNLATTFGYMNTNNINRTYITNKKRYTKALNDRLKDLEYFLQIRNYKLRDRKIYFKILGNTLFFLNYKENDVYSYMKTINKELMNSLTDISLLNIFLFCLNDNIEYLKNPKKGKKYTNRNIVKLLHITEEEQYNMKQLISKEEAEYRIAESHRNSAKKAYESTKQANKEKKQAQTNYMLTLRCNGMTNKEIAKAMNLDVRTVNTRIGKTEELHKTLEIKQEEIITEKETDLITFFNNLPYMKVNSEVFIENTSDLNAHKQEKFNELSKYINNNLLEKDNDKKQNIYLHTKITNTKSPP